MSNSYSHNSSTTSTPSGPSRPYPFQQGQAGGGGGSNINNTPHAHHSITPSPSTHHTPHHQQHHHHHSHKRRPYSGHRSHRLSSASKSKTFSPASSTSANPLFTPAMRDRQARGKDPYAHTGPDDQHQHQKRPGSPGHESDSSLEPDDFDFEPRAEDFIGRMGGIAGARKRRASRSAAAVITPLNLGDVPPPSLDVVVGDPGPLDGDSTMDRQRREWARDVLEDPELLMWYASSRNDSVPGTRLYFTRILYGYEEDQAPPPAAYRNRFKRSASGRR